jgi:two-component system sensor histidine kinase and response regulator WspE
MEERFVAAQEGRAIAAVEVDSLLQAVDVLRSLSRVKEEDAPGWMTAHQETIDALVTKLTGPADEGEYVSVEVSTAAEDTPTDATPPATQSEPEVSIAEGIAADLNLRITSQRFDRIISMSSDNLVQAQSLVRLQDHMQRVQRRLEKLIRGLAEKRQQNAHNPEKLAATLNGILAQGERERRTLGGLLHELDRMIHSHELNSEQLHKEVLRARMRPFGDVIPNLRRLVRDTAAELGKKVRFEVTGERTEVDRDILERMRAPLEHLLRNSLDHGLEMPEERSAKGKSAEGTIRIRARHENGRLAVTLDDDGRGVDIGAVSERAIERGLVRSSVASLLSEGEILEFLFLPGFSTRKEVSEISGRGFGLDVVQSTVHESGGSVRVENILGQGTAFHIVLPVTRSLVRVLLVQLEGEVYAVPLNRLSRIAALTIERAEDGSATVLAGDHRVPVISMMDTLQNGVSHVPIGPATLLFLLTEKGREAPIAFQIDRVVDETTVAVRQLDPRLGKMAAIAAVTLNEQNVPMLIVEPDDVLRLGLQAQQRQLASSPNEALTGARVLVVDDSATVRQMLRRTLLRARYHVAIAEHGAEAWNMLQVEPYDLLVSDVDMPEMNGIELVEHVRGNSRLGAMPIILLSYKGREEDRRRGLEAGADAYVTKGEFQEQAFLQTVLDLVGPAELNEANR